MRQSFLPLLLSSWEAVLTQINETDGKGCKSDCDALGMDVILLWTPWLVLRTGQPIDGCWMPCFKP